MGKINWWYLLPILIIVLGLMGPTVIFPSKDYKEPFNEILDNALSAPDNETFLENTSELKELSRSSFVKYIEKIERGLRNNLTTLQEAKEELNYRAGRHTTWQINDVLAGILMFICCIVIAIMVLLALVIRWWD